MNCRALVYFCIFIVPHWVTRLSAPDYRINLRFEMRFNMKSGQASQKKLSASAVDFPRINESYTGRSEATLFMFYFINEHN